MTMQMIANWSWSQYVILAYVVAMTIFCWWMKFTTGNRPAPGIKLWVLTAWAGFIYALISAGVWK